MRTYNRILFLFFLAVSGICAVPWYVYAYQVETLPNTPLERDFVVGPGKIEVIINPGEKKTVNITVTNRMGDERIFDLNTEDFTGSRDTQKTVVLLGEDRGPYSLKDYIATEKKSFVLKHGERATIPVTISIPSDAQPGGLYGSVLVSTVSKPSTIGGTEVNGGAAIVSRIGTLFFIRVPGKVKEDGSVKEFSTANNQVLFGGGPIPLDILFENNGSVYLNPYGEISIKNMFGSEVGSAPVDPWFSLPSSLRLREISWDKNFLFGRYTATVKINRGYDDIVDEKSVSFWVIPWKIVLGVFGAILVLLLSLRFVASKFEIKKKG